MREFVAPILGVATLREVAVVCLSFVFQTGNVVIANTSRILRT